MRIHHVCSQCGAEITRKWNLQRHINTVHGGAGVPITQAAAPFARANAAQTAAQPLRHRYGLEKIVEDRLNAWMEEKASALSGMAKPLLMYQGYVCDGCLSIDLIDIIGGQDWTHECNELWLLDHAELLKNKDAVSRVLNGRLSRVVAQVVKAGAGDGKIILKAYRADETLELQLRLQLRTLEEQRSSPTQIAYNEQWTSLMRAREAWLSPIELGDVGFAHWAYRATSCEATTLNDQELFNFVSKTGGRTFSLFKVKRWGTDVLYCMIIKLGGNH